MVCVLEVQIDAAPRPVVPYLTDFVGTSSCALAVEDSSPGLGSDRSSRKSAGLGIILTVDRPPTLTPSNSVGGTQHIIIPRITKFYTSLSDVRIK
jgi:hypothetical protein